MAMSGAAGRSAASLVLNELKGLLGRMAMKPMEQTAGVSIPAEAFRTGTFVLTEAHKKLFDRQVEHFLEELQA